MSTNTYNYPPPPPPPSQPQTGATPAYPHYQQMPYGQAQRGGSAIQGRGGFTQSAYPLHGTFGGQPAAPIGAYGQPGGPYIGPQAPNANGYQPPQQWRGSQQQQVASPLPAQNYHPNYAPQAYGQPIQQQPQHFSPQGHYPQPVHQQGAPPPQQWGGTPQNHAQSPFNGGNRGRGGARGGGGGRGGFEAPLMGPPIRMGFDRDGSTNPMPQASNGFAQYPAAPQASHQSPPLPFSPMFQPQQQYQSYPPANNFPSRGGRSFEPNQFNHGGRGRGGPSFRGRGGRGNFNQSDRGARGGKQHGGHHRHGDSSANDLSQKPVADSGAKSGEKKKKKKKRKTNTLGLTPGVEEYQESEEEDDVDEEAKLAATVSTADASGPIPEMPSDLAAWLEERRNKWPTKARREERDAALARRRQVAEEQSAKDKFKAKSEKSSGDRKLEKQRRKAEKLRKQLERAEQKVQEAQMKAGMKRKRGSGDVGDEEDGDAKIEGDAVDQVIATATASASLSDTDSDSDSDDSSEYTDATGSEDEAPVAFTSKRSAPVQVPPPAKKNILQRHCKYFSTGGTCGKKGKCRFIHDESVRAAAIREKEMNGGRMTLAQRLTQNDKEKDDLMVLKSIKYLFDKGMLDDPEPVPEQQPQPTVSQVTLSEIEHRDDVDYNE